MIFIYKILKANIDFSFVRKDLIQITVFSYKNLMEISYFRLKALINYSRSKLCEIYLSLGNKAVESNIKIYYILMYEIM